MTHLLDEIGDEAGLQELVTHFYDLMESNPSLHELHRLHFRGHGLSHTRQSQFEFLSGFFGGRPYYRERHGHMDLREIHAHVPIREEDAELWLTAFDRAIDDCRISGPATEKMRATIRRAALRLVNDVPDWRKGEGVTEQANPGRRDFRG